MYLRDWSGQIKILDHPASEGLLGLELVEVKGRAQEDGFQLEALLVLHQGDHLAMKSRAQSLQGPERQIFRPELRDYFRARTSLLSFSKAYFEKKGYEDFSVPALMEESTTDPNIALFQSKYAPLAGAGRSGTFYLQSSPELALKRALVSGAKAIFHAGSVFRNGEADATHRPEFLMLEFYRVGADLDDLMNETEAFVGALFEEAARQGFTPEKTFRGHFERLRLPELFQASTGVDLLASFEGQSLARALEAQGLGPFPDDSDFEEVFHQALVERVQERLAKIPASFIYDYPAPLALLSRLDPADSRIARRVEAYVGAMEIANGFEELTDADEYRKRFSEDRQLRSKRGLPLPPMPESFLASMEMGLPPCAGIALGLDRLIQLACGAGDLSEITPFIVPE